MADARATVDAVWRIEAPRLIGGLVRFTRDLDRAEDLAQEALLVALEKWPVTGIPDNPGAWLMTTAKHRAVDAARRQRMMAVKHDDIARTTTPWTAPDTDTIDDAVKDDVLRLMLVACHPVLSKESRVALTLRLIAGLSTAEIARAFLSTESTMAQRIVRAKRTVSEARVPFEVPSGPELHARIPPVLEVVYLIFNEGYAATHGDDWIRPALCEEAMRLGRVFAGLVPREAEIHGLLALMELQASRFKARTDARGEPVLLMDQARSSWDRLMITRGLASLARAEALEQPLGPYTLQAAIAGCHARARTPEATDWHRIVALYDALAEITRSPVVELNRAMAVSMADGPAAALPLIEALAGNPALKGYQLVAQRARRLVAQARTHDRSQGAIQQSRRASASARERAVLLARATALNE